MLQSQNVASYKKLLLCYSYCFLCKKNELYFIKQKLPLQQKYEKLQKRKRVFVIISAESYKKLNIGKKAKKSKLLL